MNEIFTQYELLQPFELPNTTLPTKTECLLYVLSRTMNKIGKHDTAVLEISRKIEDLWNKADCFPFIFKHIAELFERDYGRSTCIQNEKNIFLGRMQYKKGRIKRIQIE